MENPLKLFVSDNVIAPKGQCFVCGHYFTDGEPYKELTKFGVWVGDLCDNQDQCLTKYRTWFSQKYDELWGKER
jgi:hypothetical protein